MTDTGVVDPMRIPGWIRQPVEEAWRETPAVARLFVGLALIDIVSRGIGILQPRYDLGGDLFGAYFMLVPHDLWILLPAVLLIRRPDAAKTTPLVFWGAVVAALVALLQRPLEHVFGGPYGPTNASLEVTILASIAMALAFVFLARGLVALNPAQPSDGAAGLSNLVVGVGLIGTLFGVVQSIIATRTGYLEVGGLLALLAIVGAFRNGAWLYVLWTIIRGLGDTRRPAIGLLVGVIGAAIAGLFEPLGVVVAALAASLGPGPASDLAYALGIIATGVGQPLVVVAFALGLAEPPLPYAPPAAGAAMPLAEPGDPSAEAAAG